MIRKTSASAIITVTLVIGAAIVMALSTIITVQQVQAQGPPAKVAIILSTPPSERGSVASEGSNSGGCGRSCHI